MLQIFEDQESHLNGVVGRDRNGSFPTSAFPSINTSSYCKQDGISGYGIDGFKNTSDLMNFAMDASGDYGAECAGLR